MSFVHWFAIAAFAAAPVALAGQEKPDPADPAAKVASFTYHSAFSGAQFARDEQASPDKVWRAANDEMGRLGGHAGHIKDSAAILPGPGPTQATTNSHDKHH